MVLFWHLNCFPSLHIFTTGVELWVLWYRNYCTYVWSNNLSSGGHRDSTQDPPDHRTRSAAGGQLHREPPPGSHLSGQRTGRFSRMRRCAVSALAILVPFCAVLRFLVAPTISENSSFSTHAQMRTFLACHTLSLLRSVVDPCRSHVPGQRTVCQKRLSTHAHMRTAALAVLDPFCAVLRFQVMPLRLLLPVAYRSHVLTSFLRCACAVFRIHEILVWIRIRIRGSMPLTSGSGSGSWIRILLFLSLTFKMPAKN